MNSLEKPNPIRRIKKRYLLLVMALLFVGASVFAVTGFFRLSSETTALRESLMKGQAELWDKKIAVHVGGFSTALVRLGMHYVKLPQEARAALSAVRSGEVGVYKLRQDPGMMNTSVIFQAADKALSNKGWERVVGVAKEHELVAIYVPQKGASCAHMSCCLMVLHGRDLVVASARGNLEPILELAQAHLDLHGKIQQFAER